MPVYFKFIWMKSNKPMSVYVAFMLVYFVEIQLKYMGIGLFQLYLDEANQN